MSAIKDRNIDIEYCPKCLSSSIFYVKFDFRCDDCKWEGYRHELLFDTDKEYILLKRKLKLEKINYDSRRNL